ncbi:hypothetical protein DL96DRAFT_1562725 [Flagelloscypha sp. PMI_526]|nr:hypothetical protein DL96DRAFT_1562725 [Flagelloscypha sp. PMI_526]
MVFVPLTNSTVVTFPLGLPNQHLSGLLEPVEFQPALNLRGGINILLSCTTVIFTSVYTSYHPQPTRSEHAHIGQDNIPWHYLAYRIFILIVMPERMIFASLKDYWEARRHTNKFKKQLYLPRWSAVHSHVLAMGQFSHSIPSDTLVENCSPEQLASYSRKGILQDSDLPSVDELKELSKANVLVKVFTLFQILWLGIQCLARSLSHLPVTQIELIATSYAMYAVIAYIFWMDKPYHIERRPFVIHCTGPTDFDIHEESGFFTFEPERNNEPSQLIPFFAWNSVFPTMLEEDLWRIFSVSQIYFTPLGHGKVSGRGHEIFSQYSVSSPDLS